MRRSIVLLVCALALTGCGGSPRPAADPVQATLAGMPETLITSAEMQDRILTFDFTPETKRSRARDYRAEWEAQLVSGAVAERQIRAGDAPVRSGQVVGQRGGTIHPWPVSEPTGYFPARLASPRLWQDADLVIEQHVRQSLAAQGLRVVDVEIERPLGPAVFARAVVPPGRRTWELNDLFASAFDRRWEGGLLELDSPSGRVVVLTMTVRRVRVGGVWFAPGMDSRFGITHL